MLRPSWSCFLYCALFFKYSTVCRGMKVGDRPVPTREELRLEMRPLTGDELEKEAVAWQSRVQKKVAELSQLQLKKVPMEPVQNLWGSGGTAASYLIDSDWYLMSGSGKVVTQRNIERMRLPSSGLEFDLYNLQATLSVLKNWVMSPQGGLRLDWAVDYVWGNSFCLMDVVPRAQQGLR